MNKINTITISLILITIAIYWVSYERAFNKYQKCMIANTDIQEIAINDCLQKLK